MRPFFLLLLLPTLCFGGIPQEGPMFAGGLLAFSGTTAKKGTLGIQPYFYLSRARGFYDSNSDLRKNLNTHQYSLQLVAYYGITSRIELEAEFNMVYAHNRGEGTFSFGDTDLYLEFQILEAQEKTWIPNIRLLLGETFPSGKYDQLNARFSGSDGPGSGSFETSLIFVINKVFDADKKHPWQLTFNLSTIQFTHAIVSDLNIFGGGMGTLGKVRPGAELIADFAYEYKFTKAWGYVLELYYQHQDRSSFQTQGGDMPITSLPSTENLSFAPLIEYNVSTSLNMAAGVWFSFYGRNSFAFTNWFATIFYQF